MATICTLLHFNIYNSATVAVVSELLSGLRTQSKVVVGFSVYIDPEVPPSHRTKSLCTTADVVCHMAAPPFVMYGKLWTAVKKATSPEEDTSLWWIALGSNATRWGRTWAAGWRAVLKDSSVTAMVNTSRVRKPPPTLSDIEARMWILGGLDCDACMVRPQVLAEFYGCMTAAVYGTGVGDCYWTDYVYLQHKAITTDHTDSRLVVAEPPWGEQQGTFIEYALWQRAQLDVPVLSHPIVPTIFRTVDTYLSTVCEDSEGTDVLFPHIYRAILRFHHVQPIFALQVIQWLAKRRIGDHRHPAYRAHVTRVAVIASQFLKQVH